jgi:hypothetical protein
MTVREVLIIRLRQLRVHSIYPTEVRLELNDLERFYTESGLNAGVVYIKRLKFKESEITGNPEDNGMVYLDLSDEQPESSHFITPSEWNVFFGNELPIHEREIRS